MAWGPEGVTIHTEEVVTLEDVKNDLNRYKTENGDNFLSNYQEGDVLTLEKKSNNHRGYVRYNLKRDNTIIARYVLSTMMS